MRIIMNTKCEIEDTPIKCGEFIQWYFNNFHNGEFILDYEGSPQELKELGTYLKEHKLN